MFEKSKTFIIVDVMSTFTKKQKIQKKDDTLSDIQFSLMKKLLFFIVKKQHKLCISKSMKQKIFKIVHNQIHHDEFHHIYDRLQYSIYIRHLIKRL